MGEVGCKRIQWKGQECSSEVRPWVHHANNAQAKKAHKNTSNVLKGLELRWVLGNQLQKGKCND